MGAVSYKFYSSWMVSVLGSTYLQILFFLNGECFKFNLS